MTREAATAAWNRAALVTAVTADDRAAIAECAPGVAVRLVPDGADHLLPAVTPPANALETKPAIVFVANLADQPDPNAARRLCREILTHMHRRSPTARLLLVGNPPAGSTQAAARRPHEAPIDTAGVVVCPLPIGEALKAKLLEALARGKPMVTTSAGLGRLEPHIAGPALAVEDDPEALADAVAALLERQAERKELELRALELADGAADLGRGGRRTARLLRGARRDESARRRLTRRGLTRSSHGPR